MRPLCVNRRPSTVVYIVTSSFLVLLDNAGKVHPPKQRVQTNKSKTKHKEVKHADRNTPTPTDHATSMCEAALDQISVEQPPQATMACVKRLDSQYGHTPRTK